MSGKYILEGKTPVVCDDLLAWAKWFETAHRHVAKTLVGEGYVSTVFLGLDHNFQESGTPLLFETMVFGGSLNGEEDRYATWEEAERGHQVMVDRVKRQTE